MSKYTTQLRFIIENNSTEGNTISQRITESCSKIFNFDYPIWSETYKPVLERKILLRYFNKEIGLETVGLWKLYMEERFNSIMPYYNQLYKTVAVEYEWLIDTDITETFEGNKKVLENVKDNFIGQNTSTSNDKMNNKVDEKTIGTNTKTQKSIKSDYPQAPIGNVDYATDSIEDTGTDNRTDTSNVTGEQTNTNNSTNNANSNNIKDLNSNVDDLYTRIKKGLNGSKTMTELNEQFRASLINIDNLIVNEFKDLFMMIY